MEGALVSSYLNYIQLIFFLRRGYWANLDE